MTSAFFSLDDLLQGSVTASSSFWGGLSGTFSILNTSSEAISDWSFSFISQYNGFDFYLGEESAELNSDGTYTITVRAPAGASPLAAGARLDLGFTVNSDSDPTVTLQEVVLSAASAPAASSGSSSTSDTDTNTNTPPDTVSDPAAGMGPGSDSAIGGLAVEIQLGSGWSGTYEGTLTVRNVTNAAIPAGWSVTFISDHALRNISDFTVQQQPLADGRYAVTLSAASWASSQGLAAGASVSSYFQASGNLSGQSVADLFEIVGSTAETTSTDSGRSGGDETTAEAATGTEDGTETETGPAAGTGTATGGGAAQKRLVGYFEEWG
ncbi:MAG: hypothetical protein ACO3ZD_09665, partial [Cyanobium sp.]